QTLVMIEAKWNSPQGKDQLATQYKNACSSRRHAARIFHLYLTRRSQGMREMLGDVDAENGHSLRNVTWARLFQPPKRGQSMYWGRWVEDNISFLAKLGEQRFTGFQDPPLFKPLVSPQFFLHSRFWWRDRYARPATTPSFFHNHRT